MVRGFDIEYSFNLQQVIFDVYQYYREEEVDKIEVGNSSVIIALKNKIKIFLDLHQPEKQNPYISVYAVDSDNEFEIIPTVNFYDLDTFRTICFIYNRIYSYIKENKNNLEVKNIMKAFPKYIDLYPTAIFNLNDLIYMKVIEQDVGYELEFRIKELDTLLYFDYITGGNDYEAVQYKFIDFLSKLVNHLCENLINLK